MQRVLILGAGFGGLELAVSLSESLGDRVRVLYRPDDPEHTPSVDAFGALWEPAGFPALMGLLFLLVGTGAVFRRTV